MAVDPHHVHVRPDTAEDNILWGYNVTSKSQSYLEKVNQIFEIQPEDYNKFVSVSPRVSEAKFSSRYSDSETTISQKIASKMGVGGSYGVFSGAASMSLGTSSSSNTKTVRYDHIAKAKLFTVDSKNAFESFPEQFLTPNFKNSVLLLSNEEMELTLGTFYATKIYFGGLVEKSYIMDAYKDDNETSVKVAISGEYGKGPLSIKANAELKTELKKSSRHVNLKIEMKAQGGDSAMWLIESAEDATSILEKWRATVDYERAYAYDYMLRPMWELVSKVDATKGEEFKAYLQNKWDKEAALHVPGEFRKDLIHNHKHAAKMNGLVKVWIDFFKDEEDRAQGWLDGAFPRPSHRQRNTAWKRSAITCKETMETIQKKMADKELLTEDFVSFLMGKPIDFGKEYEGTAFQYMRYQSTQGILDKFHNSWDEGKAQEMYYNLHLHVGCLRVEVDEKMRREKVAMDEAMKEAMGKLSNLWAINITGVQL